MIDSLWRRSRRFWRPKVEDDVDVEVAFHFRMRVEQFIAAGMSAEEAERAARDRFGNVAQVRSELVGIDQRSRRRRDWRESVLGVVQDILVSVRGLRREPLFAAGVVVTLGLGIGANATMFGIIDRLMLRGPQYVSDAHQVRRLYITAMRGAAGTQTASGVGYVTYATLRDHATSFTSVAAYSPAYPRSFGVGADAQLVPVAMVTWDMFPTLGVQPLLGRFFDRSEDRPPVGLKAAVISEQFWRTQLGGNARAVGQHIMLGDGLFTVVGVAPAGFTGPERVVTDVWIPMSLYAPTPDWPTTYLAEWLDVVVRLKPGISGKRAGWEATSLLRAAYTGPDPTMRQLVASVHPLWYGPDGQPSPIANVSRWLMGVTLAVLLITCANVANLSLARSRRRRREIAVRLVLGASRSRLLRFLLAEASILALAGSLVALIVALLGGQLMRATLLSNIAWDGSGVDGRVFVFTLAIALLTGLAVGLAPAAEARRLILTQALKGSERDGGGRRTRTRASLSVIQPALSVVLLIGAALFVQSLSRAQHVNLGFEATRVIRAEPRFPEQPMPGERLGEKARQTQIMVMAIQQLQRMPWVEHASISVGSPYGNAFIVGLSVPGYASIPRLPGGGPWISAVTSDYFATVGTPLREGRMFTSTDRDGSAPVAIVNETMAKTLWPGERPLGKCLLIGDNSRPCAVVVGVVADVHLRSLRERASMQYYVPFGQERGIGGAVILVRPRGDVSAAIASLHHALLGIPQMPFTRLESMQGAIDPEFQSWRLGASMFGVFGILALVIASVGLYSVVTNLVSERTRELGVRIALGATSGRITGAVVLSALATTALGVLLGTGIALMAGRSIEPLLFDVSPRDPLIIGVIGASILAVAVLAAWVPARRASRVDPVIALRTE